ncbi:CotO family spore coat protein [Bacillus sp. TL12]|uniref:CotO family spore coat protein n=1 Tax=Bacillus sp. TL12 TaxID=2894756 RepID=UPI001F51FB20|nr:CotO family spore coat protein [Bacillus sp. TL12]MCI0764735.1 spore coat CotO family protein [Bacillus sp. TL12]
MKRKPSKKKDKRSIIYISQPTFDEAKLNMQKTFVIKPEKQVESAREEEIDIKEEIIKIKEEVDVKAEAEVIGKVKKEVRKIKEDVDVKTEAEVIEKVKKEARKIKEEVDVKAEAEVIEKVKKEARKIKEEADVKAEAEVIEEVKKEALNIKEEAEITQELQGEDNSPETEVIAAKENKEFERAALNEGKGKEIGSPKGVRKRKSFKDMNNEEKLYFLIQKPKYIPKVKCQIKTVKENLTGYILSYEEGYVGIKMMEKTKEIKVKFEDIVHIKMMGL